MREVFAAHIKTLQQAGMECPTADAGQEKCMPGVIRFCCGSVVKGIGGQTQSRRRACHR